MQILEQVILSEACRGKKKTEVTQAWNFPEYVPSLEWLHKKVDIYILFQCHAVLCYEWIKLYSLHKTITAAHSVM